MKKHKDDLARSHDSPIPGSEELLEIFDRQARPVRLDGLLRAAALPRRAKKNLEASLSELARQGRLVRLRGGLWTRPESLKSVIGRFSALRNGGGFVTPLSIPAPEQAPGKTRASGRSARPLAARDIYIHPLQSNEAWHQDLVRVMLAPRASGRNGGDFGRGPGRNPEGRIVEVLERGLKEVPAHVQSRTGRLLACTPADSRLPAAFHAELPAGAPVPEKGALVLLAPQERLASDLWSARFLGAYGREDDVAVQEELVKLNHEAPRDFPPAVLAETEALPAAPSRKDLAGREDLRSLPLVTIDGADARDFDDAVQVEGLPGGKGWLLRVAIADVSQYVPGRSALDAEALERGNSWYFPRSVEPMLPPALSNGLCSLKPQEDRLAVLAEIRFSPDGQPGATRFALAVMRSAARLTYDQVKACLLDKDPAALTALAENPRGKEILAMLAEAFRLYAVLRAARKARGSLDFDLPEPDYSFDGQGRVRKIGFRQRHDAHRLIEEFMIAANEAVARHLEASGLPFLYRVHPRPDPERLQSLFSTLTATALEPLPPRPTAASLQGILAEAQGTDRQYLVDRLCLRAMPQARYQPENEGHFGLASEAYCHFTSPIRRYADLLTHRALKASLGLALSPLPAGQKLLRIGDRLNRRERAAMDCERELARRLGCLALQGREGERFFGVISGVTDFGLFVELSAMPVEGMIRVEDLGEDWYEYDARQQCLLGRNSGVIWRLGQSLEVILEDVRPGRLEIRFMPLELPRGARKKGRRPGSSASPRSRTSRNPNVPGGAPAGKRAKQERARGKGHARRGSGGPVGQGKSRAETRTKHAGGKKR
ncbi:VacB/RNase II family 3'-5' exoribonuclease [Desulfovibrio sp. ZJ200]|uniref:ribonuclease R family protein n=1 Tax=Desulfovibrio sp. ZJ200 TaxID=2709792 RepID=UPI0013EBE47E|nr:VacB/RNase II family 3'-5' exoribonuclease [Desulfovibrio sp. ZJ200]